MRTDCDLPDKYDLNQFKAVPQIPCPDLNLSRSTSWSTVSKAALKSSIISKTLLLSSMALNMSSCTHASAVSVLWNFLYDDCNSSYISLLVIWLCSTGPCLIYDVSSDEGMAAGSGTSLMTVQPRCNDLFNKLWNIDQIWNRPEIVKNFLV